MESLLSRSFLSLGLAEFQLYHFLSHHYLVESFEYLHCFVSGLEVKESLSPHLTLLHDYDLHFIFQFLLIIVEERQHQLYEILPLNFLIDVFHIKTVTDLSLFFLELPRLSLRFGEPYVIIQVIELLLHFGIQLRFLLQVL